MKILNKLLILIMLFAMVGCGSNKAVSGASLFSESSSQVIDNEPSWYTTPEVRENWVMGKGEGVSRSKEGSRSKAVNKLINDLARKGKVIAEGRSGDFFKELGENTDSEVMSSYESIENSVWGGAVSGYVEIQSQTVVENTQDNQGRRKTIYRTYVVGGIDKAAADKELLAKIQRDKALRTAFEETKAYDKLQEDLEKYKDSFKY